MFGEAFCLKGVSGDNALQQSWCLVKFPSKTGKVFMTEEFTRSGFFVKRHCLIYSSSKERKKQEAGEEKARLFFL